MIGKYDVIDNDQDAWEQYPQHRWLFNKLEVALKAGYTAGPACSRVPFQKDTKVIVRPIYNLFGMGVGAKIHYLSTKNNKALLRNKIVPPGYFWCEYFEGKHYSIDFKSSKSPKGSIFRWEPFHAMVAQYDENNLYRFSSWKSIDPPKITFPLPHFLNHITDIKYINVEFKDDKLFEIHLRTGNDILHSWPTGSWAFPVWNDKPELINSPAFVPNFSDDIELYKSAGTNYHRLGFLVRKP